MAIPAYVLGLGPTGLGAARSLGRRRIPVFGATWRREDPALSSRYLSARVCPDPAEEPERAVEFLCEESRRIGAAPVLFTATDACTALAARYQEVLRSCFRLPPGPGEVVEALIHKWRQYQLAVQFGIEAPRTVYGATLEEASAVSCELNYPVLIKPCLGYRWRGYFPGKGIEVGDRFALAEQLKAVYARGIEVILQEIIPGPASNLLSVCCYIGSGGGVLALLAQRKIRQVPVDLGVGSLVESVRTPPEVKGAVCFLKAVGYRGPAEVEFKRDERDGRWKLIEFNLRLWEQNALAAACGLDFPYIQYLDLIGRAPEAGSGFREGVRWLALWEDLHAARTLARRGELTLWDWIVSLRGVGAHAWFSWDDPLPSARYYAVQLGSAVKAVGRRLLNGLTGGNK